MESDRLGDIIGHKSSHAATVRDDSPCGGQFGDRSHSRRERNRERTACTYDSCIEQPEGSAVCRRRLRLLTRHPARKRTIRTCERGLHRGGRHKRGLFEEADGGTIFLDEIANTTPTFQAKLLRILQEGEIKPIGGTRQQKIDVRVISASNKDLAELVNRKIFRQDLYYRLAVLPLYVPALRERREDIPLLTQHFLTASCRRHRQPVRKIADHAMRALRNAPWPGNVRQLQHYIERAVVMTPGPWLVCKDLVFDGVVAEDESLRSFSRGVVAQTERARIIDALKKTAGNRVHAAKLLKISRANLYNKLRAYGIDDTSLL